MVNADIHPSDILLQIVDAVRRRFAEFFIDKIMHVHQFRFAFRTPNAAVLFEITDKFLLFGVNGNNRTFALQKFRRLFIYELTLRKREKKGIIGEWKKIY